LSKPFRDTKSKSKKSEDDNEGQDSRNSLKLSTLSLDSSYVRSKVKQTLKKKLKQQHRRLCSKGETALVTAQRRDQKETIELHLE